MATAKNSAALVRPVQAERLRHDTSTAQPSRLSWKTAGTYTGGELQHRSSDSRMRMPGMGIGPAGGTR
jgi:hypothetical protein